MSDIRIVRDFPYPQSTVWRAMTEPELVAQWTVTGRGGRPEGFSPTVGTHFRLVGKPMPGWDGVVECEVLEADPPSVLRYTWRGDGKGRPTCVAYRLAPTDSGTRLEFEHTGFTGLGGFVMAKLILGPIRTKMLDRGLPPVLQRITP
jgi:uncharacterized protein YndB with AHSA1/START domain